MLQMSVCGMAACTASQLSGGNGVPRHLLHRVRIGVAIAETDAARRERRGAEDESSTF